MCQQGMRRDGKWNEEEVALGISLAWFDTVVQCLNLSTQIPVQIRSTAKNLLLPSGRQRAGSSIF